MSVLNDRLELALFVRRLLLFATGLVLVYIAYDTPRVDAGRAQGDAGSSADPGEHVDLCWVD